MKMKVSLFLLSMILGGYVLGYTDIPAETISVREINQLQYGSEKARATYLSLDYMDRIVKSHSPLTSKRLSDGLERASVYKKEGNYHFNIGTFDESTAGFIINAEGKLIRESGQIGVRQENGEIKWKRASILNLDVKQPGLFRVNISGREKLYKYVNDVQGWLNQNTISGKYTDKQGKVYVFDSDKLTNLTPLPTPYFVIQSPDNRDDYPNLLQGCNNPELDNLFGCVDVVVIGPRNEDQLRYGFKVDGNTLQLYQIGGESYNLVSIKPVYFLTKLKN